MRRNPVSVSRLADYASDPHGFVTRRGDVRNAAAARAGTRHHDQLGREPLGWGWILWLAVGAAVVLFLARMMSQ